jgi:tetratricopeptide (TPR) repeat protein
VVEAVPKDTEVLVACAYHLEQGGLLAEQPEAYASHAASLGDLLAELPYVNRSENLKRAIVCYTAALRVYSEQDFPVEWAGTQNNLATAYADLPTGDRAANLQQAIACFEVAARGWDSASLSKETERVRRLLTRIEELSHDFRRE